MALPDRPLTYTPSRTNGTSPRKLVFTSFIRHTCPNIETIVLDDCPSQELASDAPDVHVFVFHVLEHIPPGAPCRWVEYLGFMYGCSSEVMRAPPVLGNSTPPSCTSL